MMMLYCINTKLSTCYVTVLFYMHTCLIMHSLNEFLDLVKVKHDKRSYVTPTSTGSGETKLVTIATGRVLVDANLS